MWNRPAALDRVAALAMAAGRTDRVDLSPAIVTFKVFKPLRDGAVAFGDLAEAAMTNADVSTFLKRNNLTLDAAAAHLGIGRRLVAYSAKERAIPRAVALARRELDRILTR